MMLMISFNMQKKHVFIVILILTIFLLGGILFLTGTTRLNRVVASTEKWDRIQEERTKNDNIFLKNISFNDYPLIIDEKNSKIYYSFVETSRKYNPTIKYIGSQNKTKVVLKEQITEENLNNKPIEVMVYNDTNFRLYELFITKNPIINMKYDKMISNTTRGEILVIDNQVNANQKIIRTSASITMINDQDYTVSMRKKSVGRNDRTNDISLFGITVNHEFMLKKENKETGKTKLDLFVNNELKGEYQLDYQEQRGELNEKKY